MIIITISLKIITISIFSGNSPARTRHFEQVSAAAITAKIMEKNMSGCEKEKCGGLRKGEIGRRERGTFCPRCAVDFFAARGARPTFAVRVVLSTFLPPAVRCRLLPSALCCRLFCRPRCAVDFFAARGARLCCARGARKIAWKDVTRRAKKYKAHDPELAAVRDVS